MTATHSEARAHQPVSHWSQLVGVCLMRACEPIIGCTSLQQKPEGLSRIRTRDLPHGKRAHYRFRHSSVGIKSVLFYPKHIIKDKHITIEVMVIHNFMPWMGKIVVKKVGQELGHWYQNLRENPGTLISKKSLCPNFKILSVMLDDTDTRDARASAVSSLSEGKMETRCRFEKNCHFPDCPNSDGPPWQLIPLFLTWKLLLNISFQ